MRIVIISDTHNQHNLVQLPLGDLLIHCGDCSLGGSLREIQDFNEWLGEVKKSFKHGVLFVPGNHDFFFEDHPKEIDKVLTNAKVLINESIEIEGLKFYGSPITPTFFNWAFMKDRGSDIKGVWDRIPTDTDVLITHGPPKFILDWCESGNVGCLELAKAVERTKPKISCFGHIHESYGNHKVGETQFINASILDGEYKVKNNPIVIEVKSE